MTGFCLFCVVCQIWNLNFYVSYFLSLSLSHSHRQSIVTSSLSLVSFAHGAQFSFVFHFFFFFYRTLTIFCGDVGKGVTRVYRDGKR